MLKRKLLNFTLQQIIKNYGHIDGFTKEASPRLNFFLLGVYYNLNVFQVYYSISFLKTFFFVYNNIVIKGLPVLIVSSLNLFNKKTVKRFLQYYSFGDWTHGLFSNWLYCKSFLNVSKYPFLNREIKTIPKIIVGLNNNFFLEREVKNTYTSILTFTFINSNYFDIKRYFAPYNTDCFISINFYLKIFYSLHDRSSLLKLKFFWSFEYIEKILVNRSTKSFFKIFLKKRFYRKIRPRYLRKQQKRGGRRFYKWNFRKLINNKKWKNPRIVLLSDYDPINRILQDKIKITKMIVGNRAKFKKPNLVNKFGRYLTVNKKIFNNTFTLNKLSKKNQELELSRRKSKLFNFIYLYFQAILRLMINEKKLASAMVEIIRGSFILNKIFQFKIKKLIIFKLFLRYWKQLSLGKWIYSVD